MKKGNLKILSIGNSFSADAQRYVYGIARADRQSIKLVNLYIGGCTLAMHHRNMLSESRAYALEINGMSGTGFYTSIKEALLSCDWDYVTIQQQSLASCDPDSFIPYVDNLKEYILKYCPKAKIVLIRTWGYKNRSAKLLNAGYEKSCDMFADIKETYRQIEERISAEFTIPLGDAINRANELCVDGLYRDEFHMSLSFGRYLLGLVFYGRLTGRSIKENTFRDFDLPITEEEIELAKTIATEILEQ